MRNTSYVDYVPYESLDLDGSSVGAAVSYIAAIDEASVLLHLAVIERGEDRPYVGDMKLTIPLHAVPATTRALREAARRARRELREIEAGDEGAGE